MLAFQPSGNFWKYENNQWVYIIPSYNQIPSYNLILSTNNGVFLNLVGQTVGRIADRKRYLFIGFILSTYGNLKGYNTDQQSLVINGLVNAIFQFKCSAITYSALKTINVISETTAQAISLQCITRIDFNSKSSLKIIKVIEAVLRKQPEGISGAAKMQTATHFNIRYSQKTEASLKYNYKRKIIFRRG